MKENNFLRKCKILIRNPWRVFYRFNYCKLSHLLSDKLFLKVLFRARMGYRVNFDTPKTFNEKLQWLKLHNRDFRYTQMVDKYAARNYIKDKIGKEYLVPLIGIWDSFDEINFEELPNQFVLKCTHDSGGIIICKDKDNFDVLNAQTTINNALKDNFYYIGREWPYKDVPRKIIAEKYLFESSCPNRSFFDYRVYCFAGKAKLIYAYQAMESVCGEKPKIESCDIFDSDWVIQPFHQKSLNSSTLPRPPKNLEKMIKISERLSEEIPFLRVDFYEVDERLYVGELTFYPGSGFAPFYPEEWDYKLGEWLELPKGDGVKW